MGSANRGLRNVLRSPVRTALVVVLLSISIGLAVSMLAVNGAVGQRLEEVNQQLTPEITLRPAGSFGFFGGGEPLLVSDLTPVESIEYVVALRKTAMVRYSGASLESAVDAGTLGRRFFGGQGNAQTDQSGQAQGVGGAGFTIPIIIMGTDGSDQMTLFGGGIAQIVDGRTLTTEDSGTYVAIMGKALAEKNDIGIGSEFEIDDGDAIEIVGLFETGQRFGDNMLAMPFDTMQTVFSLGGEVTSAIAVVDSVAHLQGVAEVIRSTLGEDRVDVVTDADRLTQANSALEGASDTSRTGTLVGVGAGAAVIIFAMTMVVRDRRREIGILKAIGASDRQVVLQFSVENGAIALIAVVLALGVAMVTVQPVANQVLAGNDSTQATGPFGRFGVTSNSGPASQGRFAQSDRRFGGFLGSVTALDAGLTGGSALAAGLSGIVLVLGATLVSSLSIARIRPAEVLRGE